MDFVTCKISLFKNNEIYENISFEMVFLDDDGMKDHVVSIGL